MAPRVTGDVERMLDMTNLAPADRRAFNDEIAARRNVERAMASDVLDVLHHERRRAGTAGFDLSTEARTDALALARALRSGQVDPATARVELTRITTALSRAVDCRISFDRIDDNARRIAADPDAWADDLARRYPGIQNNFTF